MYVYFVSKYVDLWVIIPPPPPTPTSGNFGGGGGGGGYPPERGFFLSKVVGLWVVIPPPPSHQLPEIMVVGGGEGYCPEMGFYIVNPSIHPSIQTISYFYMCIYGVFPENGSPNYLCTQG